MAVNQERRTAMKRLAADLEELERNPVVGVSAAPLDDNMFEWHCNCLYKDTVYHIILFFPDEYPYKSPSAEFVPRGFHYTQGAFMDGKKGVKVCLSIFSDFSDIHTEWANEKGTGWSPGYTVQTILINVISFLAEGDSDHASDSNAKLAKKFQCKDCGHAHDKPFPPFSATPESGQQASFSTGAENSQTICYISKTRLSSDKPKSNEDLFGYGITRGGSARRPVLTTPCEYLSYGAYASMQKTLGIVHSLMKEEIAYFLPLYMHPKHGESIKQTFEATMHKIVKILPNGKTMSIQNIILQVIPNLMCATVVQFSKGTQHTSDNHLTGYFALHRLFLWALEKYDGLAEMLEDRLKNFVEHEEKRTKTACPDLGQWLMLLAASSKYRWQSVAKEFISESFRRNVMWYVKDDAKLGFLDTDMEYRLEHTFTRTAVSRKLLAFQILFLDIAAPEGMERNDLISRYDKNNGQATHEMLEAMKEACSQIERCSLWKDWFEILKVEQPTSMALYKQLADAVHYATNTEGYYIKNPEPGNGWKQVLQKYKPASCDFERGRPTNDLRMVGHRGQQRGYLGNRHGPYNRQAAEDQHDRRIPQYHDNGKFNRWKGPDRGYHAHGHYNNRGHQGNAGFDNRQNAWQQPRNDGWGRGQQHDCQERRHGQHYYRRY